MVVITDEEFASVAPEMSADIRLKNFVPLEQIPSVYFQKSYFLSPSGKSATAYNLLAATMKRTARAGIGSFVMRGHEYLVAIVSDNGVLRADTLRYADEIRSPGNIGLAARIKPSTKLKNQFIKEIEELKRDELSTAELEDTELEELQVLVEAKKKDSGNIVHQQGLETDEDEAPLQGAQIIDLTELLRRSLSKRVVVTNAQGSAPISLDERRALKGAAVGKKTSSSKRSTRA
jgi:DNA end-binding protein Ku